MRSLSLGLGLGLTLEEVMGLSLLSLNLVYCVARYFVLLFFAYMSVFN